MCRQALCPGGLCHHATSETENQVHGRFQPDVAVGQGAAVLQLPSAKNEALLVRGDAQSELNHLLQFRYVVGPTYLEGDRLTRECFHEDTIGPRFDDARYSTKVQTSPWLVPMYLRMPQALYQSPSKPTQMIGA